MKELENAIKWCEKQASEALTEYAERRRRLETSTLAYSSSGRRCAYLNVADYLRTVLRRQKQKEGVAPTKGRKK